MARVTVEDCVKRVPNRFELCLIASNRAEDILTGAPTEIENKKEKVAVIALREIGDDMVDVDKIKENILSTLKGTSSFDYEEMILEDVREVGEASEESDHEGEEPEDEEYEDEDEEDEDEYEDEEELEEEE